MNETNTHQTHRKLLAVVAVIGLLASLYLVASYAWAGNAFFMNGVTTGLTIAITLFVIYRTSPWSRR